MHHSRIDVSTFQLISLGFIPGSFHVVFGTKGGEVHKLNKTKKMLLNCHAADSAKIGKIPTLNS